MDWELRQIQGRKRALVGYSAGGSRAKTVEGQELSGTVVGRDPQPGTPVLVTGTPGNWMISGLELEPFSSPTPLSDPQIYDRKGCGKCWQLDEFASDVYLEREFRTLFLVDANGDYILDENGNRIPTVVRVPEGLRSTKVPDPYLIHWLWFGVFSRERCLLLERETGVWVEGTFAAPLPAGTDVTCFVRFFLPEDPPNQARQFNISPTISGTQLRVRWTGIPQEGAPTAGGVLREPGFYLGLNFPYETDFVLITELEVCFGSVARARVASE